MVYNTFSSSYCMRTEGVTSMLIFFKNSAVEHNKMSKFSRKKPILPNKNVSFTIILTPIPNYPPNIDIISRNLNESRKQNSSVTNS